MQVNLIFGWIALLCGIVAGALSGLEFHSDNFLGGYSSWRRRLVRLAHISFFGLGLINIVFALTARTLDTTSDLELASVMLLTGLASMPLVCYLAAFKPVLRHLFFIPVLATLLGVLLTARRLVS